MNHKSLIGKTIVVTGASSGLGREMAMQLAVEHGVTVIATGRRLEKLKLIADEVRFSSGKVIPYSLDQNDTKEVDLFCESMKSRGVDGLILNAGVTFAGEFGRADLESYESLIQTNVTSNVRLIHKLENALQRREGRIMIVASLGGLVPVPYQSVYAGSKAFMINFATSLREEYLSKNISVCICAPGGIATEMTAISQMKSLKDTLAPSDKVARETIQGYLKGRAMTVPGVKNRLVVFASRFLSRRYMAGRTEAMYRKVKEDELLTLK